MDKTEVQEVWLPERAKSSLETIRQGNPTKPLNKTQPRLQLILQTLTPQTLSLLVGVAFFYYEPIIFTPFGTKDNRRQHRCRGCRPHDSLAWPGGRGQ